MMDFAALQVVAKSFCATKQNFNVKSTHNRLEKLATRGSHNIANIATEPQLETVKKEIATQE